MLRFSLSISVILIPLLILINVIINIVTGINKGFSMNNLITSLIIFLVSVLLVFILGLIIGSITYIIDKSDIINDNIDTISTGRIIINKTKIHKIKAKRFIFLYAFTIYVKPYLRLGMLTYYFKYKEELINFIKEHSFFIEYICENDLKKLEIK